MNDYFAHYGVIGMRWGKRNGPPYPLNRSENYNKVEKFQKVLKREIKYGEFETLQSPRQTKKKRRGSCHDQVMYELAELRKMGIKADARFCIEYNSKSGQGGTTHSYVYFKDGNRICWLENAWKGKEGIHEFDSVNSIETYINKCRDLGEWGNSKKFNRVEFSDFKPDRHRYGETLQELVNTCLEED